MSWFLFIVLAFALVLWWLVSRKKKLGDADRSKVLRKWKEVEALVEERRFKEAILEADKVLDFVLKRMNIRGQGLGERLRNAESLLKSYDDLWKAHKVRNRLVHEIDFEIGPKKTQEVLNTFHKTLKDLNAL